VERFVGYCCHDQILVGALQHAHCSLSETGFENLHGRLAGKSRFDVPDSTEQYSIGLTANK
jgi:hypothetical protein